RPRRGLHAGISAAVDRAERAPTEPRSCARAAEAGGLGCPRDAPGECRDGPADDVRDPDQRPELRAYRASVREKSRAPRRRGTRAHGGRRAVRIPYETLRLRHDGGGVPARTLTG